MVTKTIKKIGLGLSTALVMVGVTACGNTSPNSASGNSTGTGKQINITLSMWGPVSSKYNFIQAFEQKYPNIHVTVEQIPQANYSQKLNTMIASNSAPDVMLVWEADIQRFAKSGAIVNLNSYIGKNLSLQPSNFIPAFRQLDQMAGGTYGLPWCYATHLLFYNKDMFDKAGLAYPTANWTWQDYENAAKKLTIVQNGKTVQWGSDALGYPGVWYSLIGSAGDQVVNSQGNLSIGQGAIQAMQWQNDLTNKLKVEPQPSAGNSQVDLFQAGKAAMTLNGSWMISQYSTIKNFKWDIAPLPYDKQQYDDIHTGFFTINSKSPNKDADWKFIQFCMSPEGQELIEKGTNNLSAELSLSKETWYQNGGASGPTNWAAFNETAKYARLGYVLLPPGVTTDLTNEFNSVLLGQTTPQNALKQGLEQATQISGS